MIVYNVPNLIPSLSIDIELSSTYWLEDALVGLIINAIPKWEVDSIILAFTVPNILCIALGYGGIENNIFPYH